MQRLAVNSPDLAAVHACRHADQPELVFSMALPCLACMDKDFEALSVRANSTIIFNIDVVNTARPLHRHRVAASG